MASILKVKDRWRCLIRRKGHSICKTFRTKGQAEEFARKIEAQIDDGQPVAWEKTTVSTLIRKYRKLRDHARPILDTSNEHYQLRTIERHLGKHEAAKITVEDLIDFATARRAEGAGLYAVNMDISKLGTVFRYAGDNLPDIIGKARPKLTYLGLMGGGGKRERRPTEDEIRRIVGAVKQPYADAILFAIATAMRRGEICRIRWEDIDEKKKLVIIRGRKHPRVKAGNDEAVPLLKEAWAIVQRQPKSEDGRIFPIHEQTISKLFTNTCRELSIPDLHFHDLRHEGTSRLFEEGYSIEQVALVTGHRSWNNLRRYANLRPEDLHED